MMKNTFKKTLLRVKNHDKDPAFHSNKDLEDNIFKFHPPIHPPKRKSSTSFFSRKLSTGSSYSHFSHKSNHSVGSGSHNSGGNINGSYAGSGKGTANRTKQDRKDIEKLFNLLRTMVEVDLSDSETLLNFEDERLLEALVQSKKLKRLNLSKNHIDDEIIEQVISDVLKVNSTLEQLWLMNNHIGPEGAEYLGEALKDNKSLRHLGLEINRIGSEGARLLGIALKDNGALKSIDLDSNRIGDEGAESLGEALKANTSLEVLSLENNNIGAEGGMALGQALKTNQTLQLLYLENNKVGDEGARLIAEALKVNTTLRMITLANNKIGDAGAGYIAEALKVNTGLKLLHLDNNKIGDAGADKLGEALEVNTTLERIWLTNDGNVAEEVEEIENTRASDCGFAEAEFFGDDSSVIFPE